MVCLNRGAARGTVGTVCTVSDFSHQILFMVSQGKYLLSFKNIFENFYIAQKMYPLRDVKDLWVGGVGKPLPFARSKVVLLLTGDSNICKYCEILTFTFLVLH